MEFGALCSHYGIVIFALCTEDMHVTTSDMILLCSSVAVLVIFQIICAVFLSEIYKVKPVTEKLPRSFIINNSSSGTLFSEVTHNVTGTDYPPYFRQDNGNFPSVAAHHSNAIDDIVSQNQASTPEKGVNLSLKNIAKALLYRNLELSTDVEYENTIIQSPYCSRNIESPSATPRTSDDVTLEPPFNPDQTCPKTEEESLTILCGSCNPESSLKQESSYDKAGDKSSHIPSALLEYAGNQNENVNSKATSMNVPSRNTAIESSDCYTENEIALVTSSTSHNTVIHEPSVNEYSTSVKTETEDEPVLVVSLNNQSNFTVSTAFVQAESSYVKTREESLSTPSASVELIANENDGTYKAIFTNTLQQSVFNKSGLPSKNDNIATISVETHKPSNIMNNDLGLSRDSSYVESKKGLLESTVNQHDVTFKAISPYSVEEDAVTESTKCSRIKNLPSLSERPVQPRDIVYESNNIQKSTCVKEEDTFSIDSVPLEFLYTCLPRSYF